MDRKQFIKDFLNYLDNLKPDFKIKEWHFIRKTNEAIGSVGGGWDGNEFPGYLFKNNENEYILRPLINNEKTYIIIDSLKSHSQVANYNIKAKNFNLIGNDITLKDLYVMTAHKKQKALVVKNAMLESGGSVDDIIFKYTIGEDMSLVVDSLLIWASRREKAKKIIKINIKQKKTKNIIMDRFKKILEHKYQIILQGPPGTGKTYTAKDIADYMIFGSVNTNKREQIENLENSGQFELIQFHPAYTYEDFVRGITAKNNDGQIEYITENKTIGTFSDKANKNYLSSKKNITEFTKEFKVEELVLDFADKIQEKLDNNEECRITDSVSITSVEEDAFRYGGEWKVKDRRMKFTDLIKAELNGVNSRKKMKVVPDISGLAKQHASYFFKVLTIFQDEYKDQLSKISEDPIPTPKLKNYILVIDEINRANLPAVLGELIYALEYRDENVKSMYGIDGDASIIIPKNLYIIGTMNTADRSVGRIDYAIRRRFAFENLLPNKEIIETDKGKEYFDKVEELFSNDNLSPDYKNSKVDIQIGHSYFMGSEGNLPLKMEYEVIPILKEYLKDGIFKESVREKIEQLKKQIEL